MSGFNLNEGRYRDKAVPEDELWSAFSYVFSSKSKKDSTYKFGFLKSIIDNLYNVDSNLRLTFDQLFGKFTEIYWNLILKYDLRQKAVTNDNRQTYLEQILHSSAEKYEIREPIPYESLTSQMMLDISHQVKIKCKRNVVGALFEDTNRLFYSFSRKDEWIQINPKMYEFICKHKVVIEKLNYYEWARFLEKVNDESKTVYLLTKIDESSKRNDLSVYRQILFDEFESKNCFYCGKTVTPDKVHVDHFIPWSFIKDDNLWNLVLACPTCNEKKNDKLPDNAFLDILIERNNKIVVKSSSTYMKNYKSRTLSYIYGWARMNGYNRIWKPSGILLNTEKRSNNENEITS
ncbi:MAG: hypothetical protein HFG75_12135 [Hungatella sp.]|nr:hypothetical protein [Hungatella sp.]